MVMSYLNIQGGQWEETSAPVVIVGVHDYYYQDFTMITIIVSTMIMNNIILPVLRTTFHTFVLFPAAFLTNLEVGPLFLEKQVFFDNQNSRKEVGRVIPMVTTHSKFAMLSFCEHHRCV